MNIQSVFPNTCLAPISFTRAEPRPARRPHAAVVKTIQHDIIEFCLTVRRQAAGLDFSRRSLASDVLSIFAAGAVVEVLHRGELKYASSARALRRMLGELFGWSAPDSAIRAGALIWAARHGESRLTAAVLAGAAAFREWQIGAGDLDLEHFRAVYVSLAA